MATQLVVLLLRTLPVVDISDSHDFKQVGVIRGSAGATDVTVVGKLAYITGGEGGVALLIVGCSLDLRTMT